MACEMFVLGDRDFRLPGLGSYLQTAASAGDMPAILWGVAVMIIVIVLIDQFLWRPVIAWVQKFKLEQVESGQTPTPWVLESLRHSRLVTQVGKRAIMPLSERLAMYFARAQHERARTAHASRASKWLLSLLGAAVVAAVSYALVQVCIIVAGLDRGELARVGVGLLGSFVRVNIALLLGAWTIPAGVAIGFSPRLARIAQPLAQIAASVPATALFPVVLLVLIRLGGGLGIASIVLMLLGTQWYILFNVIAGAIAIPTDLKEAAKVFRFGAAEKWRKLILPGIFPYLVTGLVTASGGAWNASIIAEYFHFKGQTFSTTGLGSTISHASDSGNFNLLLVATIVMALVVVTINRLLWRPLYRLAETRYRLEG